MKNVRRRLLLVAALAAAPIVASAFPASAAWACVSVDRLDLTTCVRNPIPNEPPVDVPQLPL